MDDITRSKIRRGMKVNKYDCTREDRDNYVKANVTCFVVCKKTEYRRQAAGRPQTSIHGQFIISLPEFMATKLWERWRGVIIWKWVESELRVRWWWRWCRCSSIWRLGEDDKCVVKFLDLHTISHSIQHYIMVETWNTVPPSSPSIAGLRCAGLIVI